MFDTNCVDKRKPTYLNQLLSLLDTCRVLCLGLSLEISEQGRCMGSSEGREFRQGGEGGWLLQSHLLVLLISAPAASVVQIWLSQLETD